MSRALFNTTQLLGVCWLTPNVEVRGDMKGSGGGLICGLQSIKEATRPWTVTWSSSARSAVPASAKGPGEDRGAINSRSPFSPCVVEAAAEGTPDNLRQRAATWARQNPGMPVTKRELMRIPQHSARPRSRHRHADRVDPTPARLQSLSRCCRLYDLPSSGAYSTAPRRVSPVAQGVLCHPCRR
jgi:hypothetical protein